MQDYLRTHSPCRSSLMKNPPCAISARTYRLLRLSCVVITYSIVWINRVRLPILLVVSYTEKMKISLAAFAPGNFVSQDGFGNPVPRQPAHLYTQAESGAYIRDSSRVPRRPPFTYLNRHTPSCQSRVDRVTAIAAYRWRSLP